MGIQAGLMSRECALNGLRLPRYERLKPVHCPLDYPVDDGYSQRDGCGNEFNWHLENRDVSHFDAEDCGHRNDHSNADSDEFADGGLV